MTDGPSDLYLQFLRKLDSKVDRLLDDVQDMKLRVTNIEEGQAGIHRRLDRIDVRIDRIEKRLDLVDAPH